MKTVIKAIAFCSSLCVALCAPAFGAGPIDGEVTAVWWANDFDAENDTETLSSDAGAPGLRAELWMLERYGVRASQFGSDPTDSKGADYTSVDVMWKALHPTENNFVAVGLGWQQMGVEGLRDDTSGLRVAFEGRVGILGMLYGYGHAAYLPDLEDAVAADPLASRFEDLEAYELELGVAWNATPFVNLHAGYRINTVSYSQEMSTPAGTTTPFSSGVGSGSGGLTSLGPGGGPSACDDCDPAMTGSATGETESAGFFAGVGIQF